MRFFFNTELFDNDLHGGLDAASVQGRFNQMRVFQAPFPVWKKKIRVPVNGPEISQDLQCFYRQGDEPILVAFGVSNMDSHGNGVDVSDLKGDSLTKSQA